MSGGHVVTASLLLHRVGPPRDGKNPLWRSVVKRYRRGDTVTGLNADDIERHLAAGSIAPKSSDEAKSAQESPAPVVAAEVYEAPADQASAIAAQPVVEDAAVTKPRASGTKEAWVDYAVSRGWTREKAEGTSRDKLRAAFK